MGDVGQLVLRSGIGADLDLCGDRLADAVGQHANLAHALAAEFADAALHFRNDVGLHRVKRYRGGAEHRVLHEHEDKDRQQRPGLGDRQREGITDKAADRLQLGGHHRDDLAGRGAVEGPHRKAQHALKEFVAQPAQHAFADPALPDVQVIFEGSVDQHQGKKDGAQHDQVLDLVELEAEERERERLAADRLVDDLLRQVERVIEERKRQQGDDDEIDLFRQAVAQDETIDRRLKHVADGAGEPCREKAPVAADAVQPGAGRD